LGVFMKVVAKYSLQNGEKVIKEKYKNELAEIIEIIEEVDATKLKTKMSEEKTMPGDMLYNPGELNNEYDRLFYAKGWEKKRVKCKYTNKYYINNYRKECEDGYREMDFIKNKLGVEVQFGKYAFMVYNVCAKMTIFKKMGLINAGVEIVPVKRLQSSMSTGVSYFEQFVWDLDQRGIADIDIPVLILGVDVDNPYKDQKNLGNWFAF